MRWEYSKIDFKIDPSNGFLLKIGFIERALSEIKTKYVDAAYAIIGTRL
jgi:hypothetical protein